MYVGFKSSQQLKGEIDMPKSLWFLIIGMLVNVTGASFLWPLNTIYIHDHLGKSLSVAGFVLMLNAGASVIGNLIGGTLFDKIGGYKSILSGIVITLIALVGLVFFTIGLHTLCYLSSLVLARELYFHLCTQWLERFGQKVDVSPLMPFT